MKMIPCWLRWFFFRFNFYKKKVKKLSFKIPSLNIEYHMHPYLINPRSQTNADLFQKMLTFKIYVHVTNMIELQRDCESNFLSDLQRFP